MPELVNSTAKSQLDSSRNQEPTHLSGPSYETLGGPGVNSDPGGADYKIDAARGMSTDTTIPKAVPAEGSHLNGSTVAEDDDAEVSFDDEDAMRESDDIDTELNKFNEADVEVDLEESDDEEDKLDEADDEDEKKLDEADDEDGDDKKKFNFESDEDEDKDVVKEEDEDEKKLDEADDEDGDDKKKFNFESDDEDGDDKKKFNFESDEDEDKKDLKESAVKIRIKVPAIKLNESVIPAKSQKKVAVLFEQAIKQTTRQVSGQLHKHYKALYEQKLARRDAALAKQIDGYMSYVVEEWTKQNKVAIRQSLRTELAEEFLNKFAGLMREHYIDIPASKVNVVKQLQSRLTSVTKALNEQTAKTMKVRKLAEDANKLRIVANFSRGMSAQAASKLEKLAESIRYTNSRDFKQKLTVLKESYLPTKSRKTTVLAEEMIAEPKPVKTTPAVSADPLVAASVAALKAQNAKW